jgi:glycosyltransferase involved in cell wall biosynthesis
MATAFVIEPAVRNYAGHNFTAAVGWAEAAREHGLDAQILAHVQCVIELAGEIPIKNIFSGSFYEVAPADEKEAWKRLRIMQREFRDSLAEPLMRVQPDDVIVLAHSTLVTLNGVAAWASGMPPQLLPRLVTWLVMKPRSEDFVAPFGSTDCLVAALDRLRALFGDRLTLAGSTPDVSREWEALYRGAVHILPFTALRPAIHPRGDHAASSPLSLVVAGHFGHRKGLGLIPGIIKEISQRGIEVQWKIWGTFYPEKDSPGFTELVPLAKRQSNISLVTSSDGLKEHDEFLKSGDLAILPYSPEVYRECGSGIAEEAALLGLPYVAPKVPFSAEAVSAGAAVTFDEWTAEGIASAVAKAVNTFPELSRCSDNYALRVQEQLKETRKRFLTLVFGNNGTAAAAVAAQPIPGVDIIISLHNYRRFLRESLESVSRQTYPNWRCIVVDDGSTDLNFEELRTMVTSFGNRFTYERHGTAGGQMKAIGTGLSLGSNPFVLLLDADDCLIPDALDAHVSWHLNSRVPVAFTSGNVMVVDTLGRLLAGHFDNDPCLDYADAITDLRRADAYRRPDAEFEPPSASFIRQTIGRWFWSPTSALMFRRSVMEIVLPENIDIGALGGDTYFAFACQAVGGSILIDKHVALYRRHGANGFSNASVYGAGTIALRSSSSSWEEVAKNLRAHVQSNLDRFLHQIQPQHIKRLLDETTTHIEAAVVRASLPQMAPTNADAIHRFSCWMARRRVLFGLTRRLLLGRKTEVRSLIEQSLRAHGIPNAVAAALTDKLTALRIVLGLTRRRAFGGSNSVQTLIAVIMMSV